jgi:hypothetical protein
MKVKFGKILPRMKRLPGVLAALFFSLTGYSQHYYNDIISTQQSNANYKLLKQANTSQVKGRSFEADDSETPNFRLQQELSRDKKKLTTTTTTSANVTSVTISYFENDRLKQTIDTVRGVKNITDYEYDAAGNLTRIVSQSIDPEHTGNTVEESRWYYKTDGSPDHMLRIKNKTDTVKVDFAYDEKGNLAEEQWRRKNRLIETYYYYYNDNKQLTDIVRYNAKAKKMLPDFTFDYDEKGRISQMLQTLQGTTTYLLWKYSYTESGLKQKEVCYDKNRYLVGRIEYVYSK